MFVVRWVVNYTVFSLESTLCNSICGKYFILRSDAVWTGANNQSFEGEAPPLISGLKLRYSMFHRNVAKILPDYTVPDPEALCLNVHWIEYLDTEDLTI